MWRHTRLLVFWYLKFLQNKWCWIVRSASRCVVCIFLERDEGTGSSFGRETMYNPWRPSHFLTGWCWAWHYIWTSGWAFSPVIGNVTTFLCSPVCMYGFIQWPSSLVKHALWIFWFESIFCWTRQMVLLTFQWGYTDLFWIELPFVWSTECKLVLVSLKKPLLSCLPQGKNLSDGDTK